MSFFIRGGYDTIRKQVLNISLKPTAIWHNGMVLVNKSMVVCTLHPHNVNTLELVNYNDTATLLLNNSIIYENRKLFTYKINLTVTDDSLILNDRSLDKVMDCEYINFTDIKKHNTDRYLN
uniref:Uncharacterized protein n=1 Tax=viral metagenome TaxID=1070528 RepID=A0A6C0IMY4_9ZZZZ